MRSRQVLVRAVEVVAFLFAAFSGFLKGIAPPEEATAGFSIGIASFLALCILLLLSTRVKKKSRTAERKLWVRIAGVLAIVALAAGLLYWYNRNRLTFSYPPENPQAEYIAGTQYTSGAAALAVRQLSSSQIVAQFGGLPNRHIVWSPDSIERARMILITNYLLFVLSIAGAVFSSVELSRI
jgi:uncharacterized membrane protein